MIPMKIIKSTTQETQMHPATTKGIVKRRKKKIPNQITFLKTKKEMKITKKKMEKKIVHQDSLT